MANIPITKRGVLVALLAVMLAAGVFGGLSALAGLNAGEDGSSQIQDDSENADGSSLDSEEGDSEDATGENGGSSGDDASDDVDEDVIEEDDYDTLEEYAKAIAKSMDAQSDVPEEWVDDGEHEYKYLAGTLTISFEESVSKSKAEKIIEDYGGTWVSGTFSTGVSAGFNRATAYFFEDYAGATYAELEALGEEIAQEDGVRGASVKEANNAVEESETSDPDILLQYYLASSCFDEAWSLQTCEGADITIAVIDSGFQCSHEDLADGICHYFDLNDLDTDVVDNLDTLGHGTAMAGVLGATTDNAVGIAGASYNVQLMLFRATDEENGGISWDNVIASLWIILALDVVGEGPAALNMSFGSLQMSESDENDVQELLNSIHDLGTVCVAASGNYDTSDEGGSCTSVSRYPARLDSVISVGSIDSEDVVADSSIRNEYVDLCAPGVAIYSTENAELASDGYGYSSGTSFAAPQVAAAAALLKAQKGNERPCL